jgi:hypothetical protein
MEQKQKKKDVIQGMQLNSSWSGAYIAAALLW